MLVKRKSTKYLLCFIFFLIGYLCLQTMSRNQEPSGASQDLNRKMPHEINFGKRQQTEKSNIVTTTKIEPRLDTRNDKRLSDSRSLEILKTVVNSKECLDDITIQSNLNFQNDGWVTVAKEVHIFSAYHDDGSTIKVTGIMSNTRGSFFCQVIHGLKDDERVEVHITRVKYSVIPETHGFK